MGHREIKSPAQSLENEGATIQTHRAPQPKWFHASGTMAGTQAGSGRGGW